MGKYMIDIIIKRIADNISEFEGRVTGLADIKDVEDIRQEAQTPMCFVCFDAEDPDQDFSEELGILVTNTRYAIVIVVDNTGDKDKRGHKASIDALSLREALIQQLHDWKPEGAVKRTQYNGGEFLGNNQERAWYRFDFDFSFPIVVERQSVEAFNDEVLSSVEPNVGVPHEEKYVSVASD